MSGVGRMRVACTIMVAALGLLTIASSARAAGVDYVVPPTRISPDKGLLSNPPFFREATLLVTEKGPVVVFMEDPSNAHSTREGWSCTSPPDGKSWSCAPLSRGPGGTDFADPWLADTRGDPCPTYGRGITLAALRASPNATLEPIAYHSLDNGRTWIGPEVLPHPAGIPVPIADGSKIIYTGRTYLAWRDFTFLTGEYVSQLQTVNGTCRWGQPTRIYFTPTDPNAPDYYDDGSDHPRLAATSEPGGLAVRGNFDYDVLTFHRYSPLQIEEAHSIIGAAGPESGTHYECPSLDRCLDNTYDLGQTLLYVPSTGQYLTVYQSYDPTGGNADGVDLMFQRSTDGGLTWSTPEELAGAAVDKSYLIMEPTLAYDKATGDAVLAYYESPTPKTSRLHMQLRVLRPGFPQWSRPETVHTLSYYTPGAPNGTHFGDYFGMQAAAGVAYIADSLWDAQHGGYIEYLAVRYPQ